ncbi:MAG: hypothetical protein EAZ44_03635 [Cytophagia bacterium]|nr:MAG: hypothetical protein EAZ44_03635 [Cytophagia bacterium]TAG43863.1 MAG: hypothetical protein EAZ31_03375 [Cytophagia bacterium]
MFFCCNIKINIKVVFLFICFVIFSNVLYAQKNYTIIFFDGNIKIDNQYIDIGTKISLQDKIIFENKENKVIVMNENNEKFLLDFRKYQSRKNNKIIDVLLPIEHTERNRIRCVDCPQSKTLQAILGLQKNEEPTKFIIIGDEYTLKYDCPKEKCLFMAIHYADNNRAPRVIKLAYQNEKYDLSKSLFKNMADSVAYCQLYEIPYQNYSPTKKFQQIDKADFKKGNIKAIFEPIYIEKKWIKKIVQHYLSIININKELLNYEIKANTSNNEQVKKMIIEQPENIKKLDVLYYFLSICYGKIDTNGKLDVNKVKTDNLVFENFVNEK